MSAPPVPTSSMVSCARCAARASIASALSRTPPSRRLIRPRSRRFPVRAPGSQRPVEQLDGIDAALHRCSVRRARRQWLAPSVVAGEALIDILVQPDGRLGGRARRRAVQHGPDDRAARWPGRVPRAPVDRSIRGPAARRARPSPASTCRWPKATDAPTTLAIAEIDDGGRRDLPVPHGRDVRRRACRSRRSTVRSRRGRGPSISARSVSSSNPMAEALAAGIAAVGVDTLVMLDPNCRPRRHPRPRGLPRPPRAHRATRRRRQGQHRRPRLSRAGPVACRGRRRRPRPRAVGRARDRRPAPGPHRHDRRCRPGPGPGGRGRRYGRCRRRVRRRLPRPLARARSRSRRSWPTPRPSATPSRSPSRSRSGPASDPAPIRRAAPSCPVRRRDATG